MIIVNVSGGKDSTACLLLALSKYERKDIIPIFADTNFEHSLTYQYLNYLEGKLKLKIERVKSNKYKSLLDCIEKKKIFPGGVRRFCTHELKLKPIWSFFIDNNLEDEEQWIGIRADESVQRNKKYGGVSDEPMDLFWLNPKVPKSLKKMQVRLAIINWTEKDCFAYIKKGKLQINMLYEKGHKRVGCYPCIISGLKDYKKCWKDEEGKKHIQQLFDLEEKLNKSGKLTRIKDNADRFRLKRILAMEENQIMLFDEYKNEIECKYCSI